MFIFQAIHGRIICHILFKRQFMGNDSTNIKELIKRLQNGERLSSEEMRIVANHVAQLKFEKAQRESVHRLLLTEVRKKVFPSMSRLLRLMQKQKRTDLRTILKSILLNTIPLLTKPRLVARPVLLAKMLRLLFMNKLLELKLKLQSTINQYEKEQKKKRNF